MDKVFIQGLVQLQCKRFRERGEESGEREEQTEGGREGKGKREERRKGERKTRTAGFAWRSLFEPTQGQHSQETAVWMKEAWAGEQRGSEPSWTFGFVKLLRHPPPP